MRKVLISTDTRYPVNRKIIREAVEKALEKNRIDSNEVEISVAVVGKRKMRKLTEEFVKDGQEHEVLSFPLEEITQNMEKGFVSPPDGVLRLGDIVLNWPEVVALAGTEDILVDEEMYKLVEHSVDHLLGKHHE